MADQQSAASHTGTSEVADTKGKGKAAADAGPEVSMDEESSSEEEGAEVRGPLALLFPYLYLCLT